MSASTETRRTERAATPWWQRYLTPLILVALVVLFATADRRFLTGSNMINILRQVSPLAIASFGQMLVILSGGIDISVGSLVALASVVAALGAQKAGVLSGFGMALLAGALAGGVSGWAVTRFRVQPVIATIGMLSLARGLAFAITDGMPVLGLPKGFTLLGSGYLNGIPVPVLVAATTFLALWVWLHLLPSGRALFAIGGNEDAARLTGIRVGLYRPMAYALAGSLSALAGLIYTSRAGSGQPTLGPGMELLTIAAVVLGGTPLGGGRASLTGTVLGALTVGVLSNGMDLANVSPYLQEVVLGLAIIVVVLFDWLRRRTAPGRPA